MHAREHVKRVTGLGVAIAALLALVGQSASGMNVLRTVIGDGSSSFKFAIINDIHYDDSNSPGDLRRAIDTINQYLHKEGVEFAMVNGDLANTGDTTQGREWDQVKACLRSLEVPYVPLIGNHDLQLHTGWYVDDSVYGPPPGETRDTSHIS
jgi:metallophosphoesterase superfamily enzyme